MVPFERVVVEVAVVRKVTLFRFVNFCDNSSPEIRTSDVVDS